MILNNQHETDRNRFLQIVQENLSHYKFNHLNGKSIELTQYLIERCGLLREPGPDRVDFIHKTFEEFLAAKQIAEDGNVGYLIDISSKNEVYEVICLAAMFLNKSDVNKLVSGLIEKSKTEKDGGYLQKLIAVSCKENTYHLDEKNESEIDGILNDLMPPMDSRAISAISACGDIAIPFIVRFVGYNPKIVINCIQTLSSIGSDAALDALSLFSTTNSRIVSNYILDQWIDFDLLKFAEIILPKLKIDIFRWPFVHTIDGIQYLENVTELIVEDMEFFNDLDLSLISNLDCLQVLEIKDLDCAGKLTLKIPRDLKILKIINCK